MHNSSYLTLGINITNIIPVDFKCVSRFVFQSKIELLRPNIPHNVDVIIFISIFAYPLIIKSNNFSLSKLLFCICWTFNTGKTYRINCNITCQ